MLATSRPRSCRFIKAQTQCRTVLTEIHGIEEIRLVKDAGTIGYLLRAMTIRLRTSSI